MNATKNEIKLSRKQAADLIEEIREILGKRSHTWRNLANLKDAVDAARVKDSTALDRISSLIRGAGVQDLKPCPGQAHLPEVGGNIDNCSLCAPRWGWCGFRIRIL